MYLCFGRSLGINAGEFTDLNHQFAAENAERLMDAARGCAMPRVELPADGFFVGTETFGEGYSCHPAAAECENKGSLDSHVGGYGNNMLIRQRQAWDKDVLPSVDASGNCFLEGVLRFFHGLGFIFAGCVATRNVTE
jgi:hypothetical protein